MIWLLAGLIPPLLWALVNHTDKYLLSRSEHKSSVEVLMVYSTWFSLVVLPIVFFFARSELFVSWQQVVVQIAGGVLITLSIYFYLKALSRDEASVVMPLALLVPVFGFIFSYFLLGEVLSFKQIIACMLVVFGAVILSLEFEEERKLKIKHGVLFLMMGACAFQAAQETLFKFVTIENSFAVSVFWMHLSIVACGFVLVLLKRGLFKDFLRSVRVNGKLMFGVNFLSEGVSTGAYMIQNYATLLAPIVIVTTLNSYQPAFVFLFGVALTVIAPKFVTEKIRAVHLIHKSVAIIVILIGTIFITQLI